MNGYGDTSSAGRWWVLSLVVVVVVETAICLGLFLPQTATLKEVREQRRSAEESFADALAATETFQKLRDEVAGADAGLRRMRATTERDAQDLFMTAIGAAAEEADVLILALAPVEPDEEAEAARKRAVKTLADKDARAGDKGEEEEKEEEPPKPRAEIWRLECTGEFRDLITFINGLERRGVLLDANGLTVDATERERIELEVHLKMWKPAGETRLAAEAAAPGRSGSH